MKKYKLNNSSYPPSFLPEDLDESNLQDITAMGNAFRVYLDTSTGKVHDGAVYHKEYLQGKERGNV